MDFRNLFGKKLTLATFAADLIFAAEKTVATGLRFNESGLDADFAARIR